jgi:large subunit ribosomal protein L29
MRIHSYRDMSLDELKQKRHELMEELFNLNMRKSLKELDNPLRLRTIRRNIARIDTIFSEDKLGIRKIVDSPMSILDTPANTKGKDDIIEKEGE